MSLILTLMLLYVFTLLARIGGQYHYHRRR